MRGARPLLLESQPRRIAVFRALQLGDLLCSVPALRALRAAAPQAEIVLVGLPWARELVGRFRAYLDDFVEFPGWPGLPEQEVRAGEIEPFFEEMRRRRFDLAIQLHGSGTLTNSIVARFGARRVAGFAPPEQSARDGFLPYPEELPEVRRLLRLLEHLGAPARGEALEFPLEERDRRALRAIPAAAGLEPGTYVGVHPGARWLSRRWPAERFATVAEALAERGWPVVLTGSEAERALLERVAGAMRRPPIVLAGQTDLGALAALLAGARLLVCNDTGVSHLADALRVPSVVVYSGSSPEHWGPLDRHLHRAVLEPIDCRPCRHFECPIGQLCSLAVEPGAVLAEAERLLREAPIHAA